MTHFTILLLMSIGVYFVNPTTENFTKKRTFNYEEPTTTAKKSLKEIEYAGNEGWEDE
jgi:hypothetical protein